MDALGTRRIVIVVAGVIGAVLAGWDIAEGSLALPTIAAAALALWGLGRFARIRADALVVGLVLIGYLVGNRGFAQLHVPNAPLLPGEAALALAAVLVFWHAARTRTLPFRPDALHIAVLLWMLVGLIRLVLDLRPFGFLAVRDFAMVYYAAFFFLPQAWSGMPAERRWVEACFSFGLIASAPVLLLFKVDQDWFLTHLTVAGVPLIFVKSDVAGGFMAAGTLWFAQRYARSRRWGWVLAATLCLVATVASNSRAAVVALAAGAGWLVLVRAWRALLPLAALLAVGFLGLGVHAIVTPAPFVSTPFYRLYESVASVTDLDNRRSYRATGLDDKPDNNQFRLIWWRTVIGETWEDGRWFGLGFGHDLASEFLRIYYAEGNEEFSARSPHNFLLSVFARMGLTGLLLLGGIIAAMTALTRRAGRAERTGENTTLPFWIVSWAMLASACFGVVLEGPMGAVVFWTALGLANSPAHPAAEETASALETEPTVPALQEAGRAVPLP